MPFTEGLSETSIQNYKWFVAGVKDDVLKMGISGRSWLLAANLLMRIVEENDKVTARNLINNFVVTGNVEDGAISSVTIGRKPELANINEFRNLKWIIPMKNANEMLNVPARKIEKPATLEEAYALIETMQNRATKSMFRFIRMLNYDGVVDEYKNGADIYAIDPETGANPLQMINWSVDRLLSGLPPNKLAATDRTDTNQAESSKLRYERREHERNQDRIRSFLKEKEADCAMCFYLVAKYGNEAALKSLADRLFINAQDESGLTAGDWALIARDYRAIALLVKYGARCTDKVHSNPLLHEILGHVDAIKISSDEMHVLEAALSLGFSLSAQIVCDEKVPGLPIRMSIFAAAISHANYDLIKFCLENGANPDEILIVQEGSTEYDGERKIGWTEWTDCPWDYPVMIIARNQCVDKDGKARLFRLLRSYGAIKRDEEFSDSPEVTNLLEHIPAIRSDREKVRLLMKALDCGLDPLVSSYYSCREERYAFSENDEDHEFPSPYYATIKCKVPLVYAAAKFGCHELVAKCLKGLDPNVPLPVEVFDKDEKEPDKLSVYLLDAVVDGQGKDVSPCHDMVKFLQDHGAKKHAPRKNRYL